MRYLGGISYGMYLYHGWGLTVGRHLVHGLPSLLVGYVATVGLAMVSWYLVERGFLRLKKRFEPRTEPTAITA
jgi:peptidoglycan/LPS O-acetylase OafA/YrhL